MVGLQIVIISFGETKWLGASRLISNGELKTFLPLHFHPIDLVVSEESSVGTRPKGNLILELASRLDAFSGYPFRT